MSLREQKKEDKLRRIEAAGRELFAEHGFETTKTRDIAQHAGIGAGTLFVYFPRKLDLLLHIFQQDIGHVIEDGFASLDPKLGLADSVMHVFVALFDYYERDKRLARVFVKELTFLEPSARDEITGFGLTFMQRLASLVAAAKAVGELPAHVAELEAAYHFFSAYSFSLMSWLGNVVPKEQQRWMLRRLLTILVAGMCASQQPD
jgi:AcrR family transcriptional regulator